MGIPIDRVGYIDVLKKISEFIKKGGPHQIATVNPEFIMHSMQDEDFKNDLLNSSLNTADGIGIIWASKFIKLSSPPAGEAGYKVIKSNVLNTFKNIFWLKVTLLAVLFNRRWLSSEIPERVTGADLIWKIAKEAEDKEWGIFLLGAGMGIAGKVAGKLKSKYPNIKILGTYSGRPEEEGMVGRVAEYKPDILFVAFGSPRQENFIYHNLDKLDAKVVIGVGGAFDFIAGRAHRAPGFMRRLGLEWVWRLIQQPKRIRRIWNAFPRFVKTVWKRRI